MLLELKEKLTFNLLTLLLKLLISYLKYLFLTVSILLFFPILIFIDSELGSSFQFLFFDQTELIQFLSNTQVDEIQKFLYLSLVFTFLILFLKFLFRILFKADELITFKNKAMIFVGMMSMIYLFALALILFEKRTGYELIQRFFFLYLLDVLMLSLYFLFDRIVFKLSKY